MAPTETIERLVSFRGRWAGSEAEHQAAGYLVGELRSLGREASIEPIRVRPAFHLTHALHAALAVVGSVISVSAPPLGVVILLLAGVSMYGDLTARFYLARLVMPRRTSHNVTSPGPNAGAPARLVLTAHYDAARSGLIHNLPSSRPAPRLLRPLGRLAGAIDLVFWAVMAALVLASIRLLTGVDSTAFTAAQFVPAVFLVVSVALLIDVALSDVVPGASDNASGVATVLELARRLDARPPDKLDVWVVFPGAHEGLMLGMREWLRARRGDLDPQRTFFVNVDTVGNGGVRFVTGEGFIALSRHDRRLVEISRAIADREGASAARPHVLRLGTDGVIPLTRGFPSITVCCLDESGRVPNHHKHSDTPEHVEPEAVERATDFVEELVRKAGRELVT